MENARNAARGNVKFPVHASGLGKGGVRDAPFEAVEGKECVAGACWQAGKGAHEEKYIMAPPVCHGKKFMFILLQ